MTRAVGIRRGKTRCFGVGAINGAGRSRNRAEVTRLATSTVRVHAGGNGMQNGNRTEEGQAERLVEDGDSVPPLSAGSGKLNSPGTVCTQAEEAHVVDDENLDQSSVRIPAIVPLGASTVPVLRRLLHTVAHGMSEGRVVVRAEGVRRRVSIDLVGIIADTPALNRILDGVGHRGRACCHLCTFDHRETNGVENGYLGAPY